MFFLIVFAICYFLIIVLDLVPLFKKKQFKIFTINSAVLVFAFAIQTCLVLEVKLPSIASAIIGAFNYMLK